MTITGLIAGGGSLPIKVIDAANRGGIYVACLQDALGEISQELTLYIQEHQFKNYQIFGVGQIGAIINFFKNNSVTDVIFAGNVKRPSIKSLKLDTKGMMLASKIAMQKVLGDDALLRIIAKFFESYGFNMISAQNFTGGLTSRINILVKHKKEDLLNSDIELGIKILKDIGKHDIGQSLVIENGLVIAVEAAEGTDQMIIRSKDLLKDKAGILIKMMKPGQDHKFDAPTIGPQTIINAAQSGIIGMVIEEGKVIILDYNEVVKACFKFNIFIISRKIN